MVKIRLARRGRKKAAIYDIVVANVKSPRDGRYIEKLGTYNPNSNPETVILNEERAFYWIMTGAQPTETTYKLLADKGLMLKKHLQVGVNKGAITQEAADSKLATWKQQRSAKLQAQIEALQTAKVNNKSAKLAAETKVKEARAEAIKKKAQVPATPATPAEEPAQEA